MMAVLSAKTAVRQEAESHIYYRLQGVVYEFEQALREATEAKLEKGLTACLREMWLDAQGAFAELKRRRP